MSRKRNHRMNRAVHANVCTAANLIYNNQPTLPAEADRVMLNVHIMFDSFTRGQADRQAMLTMMAFINTALICCEQYIVEGQAEAVRIFTAARDAVFEAQRIHREHGKYGLTGPASSALKEAMELYDQMIRVCTPRQLDQARREADRRIRAGDCVSA